MPNIYCITYGQLKVNQIVSRHITRRAKATRAIISMFFCFPPCYLVYTVNVAKLNAEDPVLTYRVHFSMLTESVYEFTGGETESPLTCLQTGLQVDLGVVDLGLHHNNLYFTSSFYSPQ